MRSVTKGLAPIKEGVRKLLGPWIQAQADLAVAQAEFLAAREELDATERTVSILVRALEESRRRLAAGDSPYTVRQLEYDHWDMTEPVRVRFAVATSHPDHGAVEAGEERIVSRAYLRDYEQLGIASEVVDSEIRDS